MSENKNKPTEQENKKRIWEFIPQRISEGCRPCHRRHNSGVDSLCGRDGAARAGRKESAVAEAPRIEASTDTALIELTVNGGKVSLSR